MLNKFILFETSSNIRIYKNLYFISNISNIRILIHYYTTNNFNSYYEEKQHV